MGEEALPSEYNMHIYICHTYIYIYIIDKLLQTRWDVQPSEKQLASFTMQLHATTQQLYMYGIIPAVYCRFWRRLIHFVIFSTSSLFTPCCTLVSKEIFPTRPSQSLPVNWCGLPNLLTLSASGTSIVCIWGYSNLCKVLGFKPYGARNFLLEGKIVGSKGKCSAVSEACPKIKHIPSTENFALALDTINDDRRLCLVVTWVKFDPYLPCIASFFYLGCHMGCS